MEKKIAKPKNDNENTDQVPDKSARLTSYPEGNFSGEEQEAFDVKKQDKKPYGKSIGEATDPSKLSDI